MEVFLWFIICFSAIALFFVCAIDHVIDSYLKSTETEEAAQFAIPVLKLWSAIGGHKLYDGDK